MLIQSPHFATVRSCAQIDDRATTGKETDEHKIYVGRDIVKRMAEDPYTVLFQLINHEKHHHGQLINFMFCHHLPIPPGWEYAA